MPDAQNRTTEAELSKVVLEILSAKHGGEASFSELVNEVPRRVNLTPEDLQQSDTRRNEAIWEQRVRNITSHKNVPGNIIFEGFAESIRGGLRITDAGRLHVQHNP
jgi:hypothetical protein